MHHSPHFTDDVVTLYGVKLESLFAKIMARSVDEVHQIDQTHAQMQGKSSFVSEIVVTPRGE